MIAPKLSPQPWADPFTMRLALLCGPTLTADGEVLVAQHSDSEVLVSGNVVVQNDGGISTFVLYAASGVAMVGDVAAGMTKREGASLAVHIVVDVNAPIAGTFMRAMRPKEQ